MTNLKTDTATFGAGCFWCVEAVFQQLDGVLKVTSGYSGGNIPNPTYEQVCTKQTGYVEVCRIVYDPTKITFDQLLEVFWKTHDPTTPLPGGESRLQVAARLCQAFDTVLQRPEHCALVVTHELLIALLQDAIEGQFIGQKHPDVAYASPYHLAAADVARGIAFLQEWVASEL